MKKITGILVFAAIVSFTVVKQTSSFEQLQVLAGGTWVMKAKTSTICEEWEKKNNNLLTSRSYRVKGKDTTQQETVALSLQANEIYYTSTVPDQNNAKPVPFKLIESKGMKFTFSNPQHDFPQRIIYEFVNRDSLHAWIEGTYISEGTTVPKEIRRDFYYARVR
jgi:hypothetical protein